jgi:hypothetical protein
VPHKRAPVASPCVGTFREPEIICCVGYLIDSAACPDF